MKRALRIGLGVVIALMVVAGVALFYLGRMLATFATTIPPAARPNLTPASLGLPFREWETASEDGIRLSAWWVPAAPGVPEREPVIVIHGLGASKEFMLSYISLIHADGRPALAIDLRGHGESEPGPTTLGAREPLDVKAWAALLRSQGHPHPVLWGTSLGAMTALRAAAANPDIGGVIADAPFDTLRHTMAVHARLFFGLPEYPFVPLTVWEVERSLHFKVADVDGYRAVAALKCPLLLLAAENDRRMSLDSIQALYAAAHEPKRFYLIRGEDHERRRFPPDFRAEVTGFLDSCDGGQIPAPVPANGETSAAAR